MTKKLALQQGFGHGRTVNRNKRRLPGSLRAEHHMVNMACHHFFAGAAFSRNEDIGNPRPGNFFDFSLQLLYGAGFSDNILFKNVRIGFAQIVDFLPEVFSFDDVADDDFDLIGVKRFGQIIRRTELHGLDRHFGAVIGGQHDNLGVDAAVLDFFQNLDSAAGGHTDIQQHDIRIKGADFFYDTLAFVF